MTAGPLKVWRERDGKLLRLRLDRPKATLVDNAMVKALDKALAEGEGDRGLLAVLIDHAGPHFSYGASIQEHLPETCAGMLRLFHGLVGHMVAYPLPILVAARGHCLGGGLELASAGTLIFTTPDANLGQPEIKLGVYAPAASCLLPERIGHTAAMDLLLSGRSITGEEAKTLGLVTETAADPEIAALSYFEVHYAGLSASSLRFAVKAADGGRARRIKARLAEVEKLYLDGLMKTADPVEGLAAFLEKRPPRWNNR
jgi:cyclohexa-1,5-dienecarbonyl-CoA hydratase